MEREILCLILDQCDEYELFTSPEELIKWLKSFNVMPSRVLDKIIVHYKDNPRFPVHYDLMPFISESPVNQSEWKELVDNWKKLDENISKTVTNYTKQTDAEIGQQAMNLLKYNWK